MLYPTTETVIKNLMNEEKFKETFPWGEVAINTAKKWKEENWKEEKKLAQYEKWNSIARITINIARIVLPNKALEIQIEDVGVFNPFRSRNHISTTDSSRYDVRHQTIILEGNPSIITAWHELGHHLFGTDELQACIFSISLFKIVFPKAFKKLNWNGHMLTL